MEETAITDKAVLINLERTLSSPESDLAQPARYRPAPRPFTGHRRRNRRIRDEAMAAEARPKKASVLGSGTGAAAGTSAGSGVSSKACKLDGFPPTAAIPTICPWSLMPVAEVKVRLEEPGMRLFRSTVVPPWERKACRSPSLLRPLDGDAVPTICPSALTAFAAPELAARPGNRVHPACGV